MLFYYLCVKQKKSELLLQVIDNNDGYVSVKEAGEKGIERTYLMDLVESGYLRKVGRGLYLKRGLPLDPYYLLHFTYRKAVFAGASALYLHGLIDENEILEVILPANYMTKGIEGAKSRHVGKKEYEAGLSLTVSPHGTLVPCLDLERTLIDTIRYIDRFGKETWQHVWERGLSKNPYRSKLEDYARAFHCESALSVIFKTMK